MGYNPDNPCPICDSYLGKYAGNNIHICRGCGNQFDTGTWTWERTKKEPEDIEFTEADIELIKTLVSSEIWQQRLNESASALIGLEKKLCTYNTKKEYMKEIKMIKRYDHELEREFTSSWIISVEDEDGDWVKHEDHLKEVKRLEDTVVEQLDFINELITEINKEL